MFDDEDYSTLTFSYRNRLGGTSKNIDVNIEDAEAYPDILQEFVYFLQAMGFTYIAGITVLNDAGEELHTTDF